MTDSLFVDSNIWLYSFIDSYQEKYEISKNLIKSKEENLTRIY
jgi:predicted nucleic acid-binding protein